MMKNDLETIRNEFRQSETARYVHRLHGVLLVLRGLSTVKAGKLLGDPQRTIAHWVVQFKARGLAGLKDAEKSGRQEIVSATQKKTLAAAIAKPPSASGMKADSWTGQTVSTFLLKNYTIKLSPRQCYRILAALKNQTKI